MPLDLQITRLSEALLDEAADIQARAFYDDPLFAFVFPDARERRARLAWLMRMGVAYGCKYGHVDTTAETMLGHAVWLPPGNTHMDEARLAEAGFVNPEAHMGADALERFAAFMAQIGPIHERLMPEPHWYLMILGVDPRHQGQRVGSMLIQSMLAHADAQQLRCYLETAKPRNVPFYQKHGFEVVEEAEIVGGGPHVWLMVRAARSSAMAA
jgi:ribosomal protein S18 acetylase RimI-like enzyme